MTEIKAKKVIFKNRDGEHLIPYVGDTAVENRITNCLLEVPQRIKYELNEGTLTIKAGSVVIVPYGTEDLTSQFPKGATFINDSFKVYDTQFSDGKFFVWAELVNDSSQNNASTTTADGCCSMSINKECIWARRNLESGTSATTASKTWTIYYNTDTNLVGQSGDTTTLLYDGLLSLPLMIYTSDGTNGFGSIKQVFQGIGYIGSTIWVDKGIKWLIPNGRNEDGSLRNIETANNKVLTYTNSVLRQNASLCLGNLFISPQNILLYDAERNINLSGGTDPIQLVNIATWSADSTGVISNFQPKLPFRAVDWNDYRTEMDAKISSPITALCTAKATTTSSASSTKPAVVVKNYKNGYSWYRVWSDGWIEQGGQDSTNSADATITLLYKFTATNYYVNLQLVNQRSGSQQNITPYSKTVSNFKRSCNGGTEYQNPIAWYACGY